MYASYTQTCRLPRGHEEKHDDEFIPLNEDDEDDEQCNFKKIIIDAWYEEEEEHLEVYTSDLQ